MSGTRCPGCQGTVGPARDHKGKRVTVEVSFANHQKSCPSRVRASTNHQEKP